MIRSDYDADARPARCACARRSRSSAARAELATLRALVPWAEGEGRRVVLARRRGGLRQEPPRARVRGRGGRAAARSSSTAPATPSCARRTARSSRRSTSSRGSSSRRAARRARRAGGELTGCSRPRGPRRRPAARSADPDTERHRLHTAVDRPARAAQPRPAGAARARGRALGRRADAAAAAPPRARRRRRAACCCSPRSATPRPTSPETLAETLADLRRSEDVVRLRLGGLSDDEVTEFVRRAAGGDAGPPELARDDRRAHRRQRVPGLRAVARAGRDRRRRGRGGAVRSPGRSPSSARPRACARSSASGSRGWRRAPRDLLELAAAAGPEFELDVSGAPPARRAASSLAALDEAVRSGMIEELPVAAAGLPVHPRARAPRAVRPALGRAARGAAPARRRGARARTGARGRALADLAHHFAAAAPFGGAERGVEYNVLAARAATAGAGLRRGGGAAAHRARARDRRPGASAPRRCSSSGTASHRAGQRARRARRRSATAAEIARELGDARAARPRRDRLRGRVLAPGDRRPGRGRAARGGRRPRSATSSSELRVGLLGGLARALDFRGDHERAARSCARAPSRWPAQLGDRAGPRDGAGRAPTGRAARARCEEILAMLTEAARPRRGARATPSSVAEAMAWRVPAFVALGDLDAARREVAALLRDAPSGRAQPFMLHVAEHYGVGDRALRRPPRRGRGAGRGARTSGAGCSPAATPPGSTASRCSGSGASRDAWRSSRR